MFHGNNYDYVCNHNGTVYHLPLEIAEKDKLKDFIYIGTRPNYISRSGKTEHLDKNTPFERILSLLADMYVQNGKLYVCCDRGQDRSRFLAYLI
jgi:hypothetical protein